MFCLVLLTNCSSEKQRSSNFQVFSLVDTTKATVGDMINVQIWVKGAADRIIQFPNWNLEDENINVRKTKDLSGEYKDEYGVEFQLTLWDTGSFEIPPYSVNIMQETKDTVDYSISTDPFQIIVQSVIKEDQPNLRDIKQPVPIPIILPWREIISIVTILLLMGLLIYLWRKRVQPSPDEKTRYNINRHPYDIAIEKLEQLKSQPLFDPSDIMEFYVTLSFVVREFIENQFFIRAIEMTTSEIDLAKDLIPVDYQSATTLLDVLKRADLTKFAKYQPDSNQCSKDLEKIETFILDTRISWPGMAFNKQTVYIQ